MALSGIAAIHHYNNLAVTKNKSNQVIMLIELIEIRNTIQIDITDRHLYTYKNIETSNSISIIKILNLASTF